MSCWMMKPIQNSGEPSRRLDDGDLVTSFGQTCIVVFGFLFVVHYQRRSKLIVFFRCKGRRRWQPLGYMLDEGGW
jgi:hypothetical protein